MAHDPALDLSLILYLMDPRTFSEKLSTFAQPEHLYNEQTLLQKVLFLSRNHHSFYTLTLNSLYCRNVRIASCGHVELISEMYPGHARQRKKS